MQNIYIINQSTGFSNDSVSAMLPALQEQLDRDLAPLWGVTAKLYFISQTDLQSGWWSIIIKDRANLNGDLGFHTDAGIPQAIVGVLDAQQYSVPVSTVVSHEMNEMMIDPTASRMVGSYIMEVCDPVTEYYYNIGDVQVSNFCTPRYFGLTNIGHFDQMGILSSGLPTMAPGGMLMYWNGTTWTNIFNRNMDGRLSWRVHMNGRNTHRAINHNAPNIGDSENIKFQSPKRPNWSLTDPIYDYSLCNSMSEIFNKICIPLTKVGSTC